MAMWLLLHCSLIWVRSSPSGFTASISSTVTAFASTSWGLRLYFMKSDSSPTAAPLWGTVSTGQGCQNDKISCSITYDGIFLLPCAKLHLAFYPQPALLHTHVRSCANILHQKNVNFYEFITSTESCLDKGN